MICKFCRESPDKYFKVKVNIETAFIDTVLKEEVASPSPYKLKVCGVCLLKLVDVFERPGNQYRNHLKEFIKRNKQYEKSGTGQGGTKVR